MSNASSKHSVKSPSHHEVQPSPTDTGKPKILPWGVTGAILVTVLGFVFTQLLAQLLVGVLPVVLGTDPEVVNRWLDTPAATFIYVLLAEAGTISILIWFIRSRKADFWQSVGLRKLRKWDLPIGVAGFLGYILLYTLILTVVSNIVPIDTGQEQAIGFAHDVRGVGLIMAFASLVILPPIVEEIVFRGFLFGTLRRRGVSFAWTTVVISLIFGMMHLFGGGGDSVIIWVAFLDTFVVSLVLCYLREKTGSILAGMALHALKNALVFVNLFIIGVS